MSVIITIIELLIAWQLIQMFLMPRIDVNLPFFHVKANYVRGNKVW